MGEFYGNQHTGATYDDYTYEDLVGDVSELAADLGRPPTTAEAAEDERLPSIATMYDMIEEDWSTVLERAGVDSESVPIGAYDSDDCEEMIEDLRRANAKTTGDTLTMREYDEYGQFATSTVKVHLGSWADACEAANIECGQRHGERCLGPNGNRLDSRHELEVARYLDTHAIEYETHVRLGVTLWRCDFYLRDADLWIEVDGYVAGGRPNERSFAQKLGYYAFRGMDFAVVESTTDLERELRERDSVSAVVSRQTKEPRPNNSGQGP